MFDRESIPTPFFLSEEDIAHFKKLAKRLKKQTPAITHSEALDIIALEQGCTHWKTLTKRKNSKVVFELVLKNLPILLFDIKDFMAFEENARNVMCWQSSEALAWSLMPMLYENYIETYEPIDDEDDGPRSYRDFCEAMHYVAVFPADENVTNARHEDFIKKVMDLSFFAPDYAVLDGELHFLFHRGNNTISNKLRKLVGCKERGVDF